MSYVEWVWAGRPHNFLLQRMRQTRAAFKLALRYCQAHEEQSRTDAYAKSLNDKDSTKFWRWVHKDSSRIEKRRKIKQ